MEPAHQTSLLSLTGRVDNLLLSYVSSGEEGLQNLLNLREVCQTTRSWVDDQLPVRGKKIFSTSKATVKLYGEYNGENQNRSQTLRRFLENPPPPHVTSLCLTGMLWNYDLEFRTLSPEERQLWTQFVTYWWPRLESLEVDAIDNLVDPSGDSFVSQLMSSSSLKRLHCGHMEYLKPPFSVPRRHKEFPQRLFQMEHISISNFRLQISTTNQFFTLLAKSKKLKTFQLNLSCSSCDFKRISKFIDSTKGNPNLEGLTFKMNNNGDPFRQQFLQFVSAVSASSTSIRILNCHGKMLVNLAEVVGRETANQFFRKVEWISEFEVNSTDKRLLKFPNLKRLDLLKNSKDAVQNVLFPKRLEQLGVEFGIPQRLPNCLTRLTIQNCRSSSVDQLLKSLISIDEGCPLLNLLELTCDAKVFQKVCKRCSTDGNSEHPESSTSTRFQNLRSLTFFIQPNSNSKDEVRHRLNGASCVLLGGLQVPQLSLLNFHLDVDWWRSSEAQPTPLLDSSTLTRFINGKVANTLLRVEIGDSFVCRDAIPLEETLNEMAAEKRQKLSQRRWESICHKWTNSFGFD